MEYQDLLAELMEFVQGAAPSLWAVAMRQARVVAMQYFAWSFVVATIGVALGLMTKNIYGKYRYDKDVERQRFSDWEFPTYVSLVITVLAALLSFWLLMSGISMVLNMEYYAIEALISLVPR